MDKEVTLAEVRHMAQLSRLAINEEEEKIFSRQFAEILGYMDILATVDTDGVEPLYSPLNHSALCRDDLDNNRRSQRDVLDNAPETDGEMFIVPRIV